MDTRSGDLYPTKQAALDAGVPERDIAEVKGSRRAVGRLRMAARDAGRRRANRKRQQKSSRKANR